MDLSLIYELSAPTGSDQDRVHRTFWEAVEQIELADRLGYRTVWFTEHHFLPGFAHSSAPEVMMAYLAARTENIRLGHAVTLLPHNINHPARIAERTATLDILCQGRLEFGGGRAITPAELLGFEVSPDDSKTQWEETLRMLPGMWTEDSFSYKGTFIDFPERAITPKPVQQPHPPMWTACTQPATVEAAGRFGIGALTFGVGYQAIEDYVKTYRAAIANAEPVGKFVNNRFATWVHCLCAPTDEEAADIQGANFFHYIDTVAELFAPWVNGQPPKTYEYFVNLWNQAAEMLHQASVADLVAAGTAAIGSPETVGEVLEHLARSGVDEALLFMQNYDAPHEAVMRSIEMIAKEVMPNVNGSRTS